MVHCVQARDALRPHVEKAGGWIEGGWRLQGEKQLPSAMRRPGMYSKNASRAGDKNPDLPSGWLGRYYRELTAATVEIEARRNIARGPVR